MNTGASRRNTILSLLIGLTLVSIAPAGPDRNEDLRREHRERRKALCEAIDEGTIVLLGPASSGTRAVATEPNFFYLSGLTETESALVITIRRPASTERARRVFEVADQIEQSTIRLREIQRELRSPRLWRELAPLWQMADRAVRNARAKMRDERGPGTIETRLYLRAHSPQRARWEGPALSPGPAAVEATGIATVLPRKRLISDLLELPEGSSLYLLDPGVPDATFRDALIRKRPDLDLRHAKRAIAPLRAVKSETEVARIRFACELTARGLLESMRACRPGMNEFELQAHLEFSCRRGGANRQAFDSIVASGPNSTILHYCKNERTVEDGDLVLMDVGGEYRGYAADITRTFPANGRFTEEQARIYDVVLRAQKAAIAAVKPGAGIADVNSAARKVFDEAGLMDGWMHGTSHHVGLDVHDPGAPGPLVPGMVFTVEPGLYFPESGIGIRIEDTVVVTADGCEVLSAKITKERLEIEAIMADCRLTEERGK